MYYCSSEAITLSSALKATKLSRDLINVGGQNDKIRLENNTAHLNHSWEINNNPMHTVGFGVWGCKVVFFDVRRDVSRFSTSVCASSNYIHVIQIKKKLTYTKQWSTKLGSAYRALIPLSMSLNKDALTSKETLNSRIQMYNSYNLQEVSICFIW